jgi:hypothetical protein
MPGSVVGKGLNLGYPGNVSRSADAIINNRVVKLTDSVGLNFGDPAILNSDNTYSKFGAGNTATQFAGVAVREVKQSVSYTGNGQGTYAPGEPCDVIGRGTVIVTCSVGTPTAGGEVYLRTILNAGIPLGVVGGYEAAADSTNSVLITNAKWTTGKMDANRAAEVTILSRILP